MGSRLRKVGQHRKLAGFGGQAWLRWVTFIPLAVIAMVGILAWADGHLFGRMAYFAGVSWGQLPFFDAFTPLSWFECAQKGVDIRIENPCDTRSHLKFPMSYPPAWLWLNFDGLGTAHTNAVGLAWGGAMLLSMALLPAPRSALSAGVFLAAALSHAVLFALYQANFDVVIFAALVVAMRLSLLQPVWRACVYVLVTILAAFKIYPFVALVLLLRERLAVLVAVGCACTLALLLHVVLTLDDWRLAVSMIPGRDPITMFGARNILRGILVLWGYEAGAAGAVAVYAGIAALAVAVFVFCVRMEMREGVLKRLDDLELNTILLFGFVIVFCFVSAQNFMYRAIFLMPLILPFVGMFQNARSAGARLLLGSVLVAILACLWGGYALSALDFVQKTIHNADAPPNNAIRAVAWTVREMAWWFTMSAVAAFLAMVVGRTRAARQAWAALRAAQ